MANLYGYDGYFDKHVRERFMLNWGWNGTVNVQNAYDGASFVSPMEQKNFLHNLVKYVDSPWEVKEIIGTHHDLFSQCYLDCALYFGDDGEPERANIPAAEDVFKKWKDKLRLYEKMGFKIDPSIKDYLK